LPLLPDKLQRGFKDSFCHDLPDESTENGTSVIIIISVVIVIIIIIIIIIVKQACP
jgi:hypothetical protein